MECCRPDHGYTHDRWNYFYYTVVTTVMKWVILKYTIVFSAVALCGSCLRCWAALMPSSRGSSCSLSREVPDYLWEVSYFTLHHSQPERKDPADLNVHVCVLILLRSSVRISKPESTVDHCEEDIWVVGESGWLSPLGHDLRQLPEAAWLLQHRDHARETVDCSSRGPAVLPPFLISSHLAFKCLQQRLIKSWLPP